MGGKGLETFESLKIVLGTDVQLVTPDIIEQYNDTDAPFHKALNYLSPNHKADYLHAYFMHHYGGGYMELREKMNNKTWEDAFDYVGENESHWFLGTAGNADEVTCDESNVDDEWCKEWHMGPQSNGVAYADTRKG